MTQPLFPSTITFREAFDYENCGQVTPGLGASTRQCLRKGGMNGKVAVSALSSSTAPDASDGQ